MDKQKILIVDDSEINRALLADILDENYNVVEAENGAEAITILSKQREDFSLLLLDIMMPEMDGFEVLAYIHKYRWDDTFAVIMISADDSPTNIKRAYDLGAFDYISRPFDSTIVQRRISNTMLLYARQQRLEKIIVEQFYEQEKNNNLMISILSHIVEFRNGESGLHILRVKSITKYLLEKLVQHTDRYPLSKADISLISTASALHDIGKISISDQVLNKPGRLTEFEFEIIKTHSMVGANMLLGLPKEQQETPIVKVASEICRWHHERYDGNGYPDGLRGDEIPIAAQVVALADVYDALTSERCYKKAYSHEEAMEMILEGQCGAFNPTLLLCLQEITEILKNELMDTSPKQGDKSIQDIRNSIDYDRLLSHRKHPTLPWKQHLPRLLYMDSLTGIYNRRYFDEQFQSTNDIQAIVVLDVDNFKHINDNYGHGTGDVVLQILAKTILSCIRKTDAVIRYGGDEFVLIFNDIPANAFEKKLERIRSFINDLTIDGIPELQLSVSIGGAYGPKTTKKLFKVADNMMYQSKNKKNRVTVCFLDENEDSIDNI
ncbi:Cyclic di-GMP phosphodiesterase response regulator RpfG [Anaerotruncus sp. 2789STDY5834896]|uniref:Stage 0 sporulation protein A homolog n=1 Tax=uncultured Anaerotruncus sp. TaxID=905011 RepID=A0A1C6JH86_9FIRM|nr:Cyclic di-GMP phosphodiesterase response regulator RpfG [uncultured Anaerotruncus sp.]